MKTISGIFGSVSSMRAQIPATDVFTDTAFLLNRFVVSGALRMRIRCDSGLYLIKRQ